MSNEVGRVTVTPELAQEMLDRVEEGCPLPWEIFTLETIEEDPREVKNVRCSEPGCDGHLAYSMDYDGTTEIDPDAIELVAAAPALAELVANLRYEYAAQVEKNGHKYIVTDSDEGHWLCGDDHKVLQNWHPCYMDAEEYAHSWNNIDGKRDGTTARIVRRLVSEPEVAE